MKRKHQFIKNVLILTAVSLFMRAVSFSFNVYAANKIGASGMGLYALIMAVYNFGITFASSGIHLVSTKIIAEEIAVGKNKKAAVLKCMQYAGFFGVLAFFIIFFGAEFFSVNVVDDKRVVMPLKILSVSLPCVAGSFALSGYFTATGKVYKNSIVQITEQMLKISGTIYLLSQAGANTAESACKSLVTANTAAEIISFVLLYIVYKADIKRENKENSKDLTGRVLRYGLPVAVSAYIRSGLTMTENTLIPKSLTKFSGIKESALSAYGVVHGMVMPLIHLPSGVVGAVSALLVPEITGLYKIKNYRKIDEIIERVLSATLTFSVGAAGILYFFAEEIGSLFYDDSNASYFLKMIAPVVVIMYSDGVVDAILKGLNQEIYAMRYDIVLSCISIVLIVTLIPVNGVEGYILIVYISEMLNSYLSINRLLEVSDFKFKPVRWAIVPAALVTSASLFAKSLLSGVWGILCAVFIYVIVISLYRGKATLYKRMDLW